MAMDIFLLVVLTLLCLAAMILVPFFVRLWLSDWQRRPEHTRDISLFGRFFWAAISLLVVGLIVYFLAILFISWMTMAVLSPLDMALNFSFLAGLIYLLTDMIVQPRKNT